MRSLFENKKRFMFVLVLIYLHLFIGISFSQKIDNIRISPGNLNENDEIKIYVLTRRTSSDCRLVDSSISISGNTINLNAAYSAGFAAMPCSSLDVFEIGSLPAGEYKLIFSSYEQSIEEAYLYDTRSWDFSVAPNSEKLFIDLSKIWLMVESDEINDPQTYNYFYTKIGEQEIIDGICYNKLLISQDTTSLNWRVFGYIRETIEQEVYFRKSMNDYIFDEQLMFAFNASVGDTFNTYHIYFNRYDPFVITGIDSVELISGKAKRLSVAFFKPNTPNLPYAYTEWIYNIGDYNRGLIPNSQMLGNSNNNILACYFSNGELKMSKPILDTIACKCNYPNITYSDTSSSTNVIYKTDRVICEDTVYLYDTVVHYDTIKIIITDSTANPGIINVNEEITARIFPNPADKIVHISLNNIVDESYFKIFNIFGALMFTSDIYSNTDLMYFNVEPYTAGIYLMQLFIDKEEFLLKIVIE